MISLMSRDAKETFLEHGILAIPKGKPEADTLMVVAYTSYAILTPPIRSRACLFMWKMIPGIAISGIILADSGLGRK
jgi:hypothetical protein